MLAGFVTSACTNSVLLFRNIVASITTFTEWFRNVYMYSKPAYAQFSVMHSALLPAVNA